MLDAAIQMDEYGAKALSKEIIEVKVLVSGPCLLSTAPCRPLGVSQDTPPHGEGGIWAR